MSESIELQVNLNTLIQAGWCVEMETGLRGGEIRSWVKLRHWDGGKSHKVRAVPTDLNSAVAMVMLEAGLQPYRHALETCAAPEPPESTWTCSVCDRTNYSTETHCRQCEYSRMVTLRGKEVPRVGRL